MKRHASSTDSEIQSKLPHREAQHDHLRSFIDWAMVKGFELNDKVGKSMGTKANLYIWAL